MGNSERTGARLKPIASARSLAEDAADRIREQILAGGFGPGDHLVEAKIAEQLAISRGPVREAFRLLRADGLLKDEPRRGTFVVRLTSEDVLEMYGVRAALEAEAGRLIARSGNAAAISELGRLAAAIDEAAAGGDPRAVSRADLAFHEGLCRLCGNRRISELFTRYVPTLRSLIRLDERILPSLEDVPVQHAPVVGAIAAGDGNLAAALLSEHAERAGSLVADYMSERDEGGQRQPR